MSESGLFSFGVSFVVSLGVKDSFFSAGSIVVGVFSVCGALPKSGLAGNPPVVDDGVGLEKDLKGLGLEPPKANVLLEVEPNPVVGDDEPKPPFAGDAASAPNPPPEVVVDPKVVDPNADLDPKVAVEDPNTVVAGFESVGVPMVEVLPKADSPSEEVAPKAANGEVPDELVPNASPLELPDPKVDGDEAPNPGLVAVAEPNVVDPETPKEKGVLAVVVDAVSGALGFNSTGFAASAVSSITTQLSFSTATVAIGSLGKLSVDPCKDAKKNSGSLVC